MPPEVQKLLFDRHSAALTLSVSVRTVDYYIARGEVQTIRKGRKVLISASELKRFASKNHYEPVAGTSRAADDAPKGRAA